MITGRDKLNGEEAEYEKHNRNLRLKICYKVVKLGLIFEGGKRVYRVIQNDCRGFNSLSYTIRLR